MPPATQSSLILPYLHCRGGEATKAVAKTALFTFAANRVPGLAAFRVASSSTVVQSAFKTGVAFLKDKVAERSAARAAAEGAGAAAAGAAAAEIAADDRGVAAAEPIVQLFSPGENRCLVLAQPCFERVTYLPGRQAFAMRHCTKIE